jgi:predicted deacylase
MPITKMLAVIKNSLAILVVCSFTSLQLQAAQTLEVAGTSISAGSRENIMLNVAAGTNSPATFIPVTVINGAKDGPILATVAGVHGYEYISILATEKWAESLSPQDISGALIIVRLAHVPAFEERAIYVNPYDRKNLNRSFPGSNNGTQTERIAHAISTHVVSNADFLIDLHSGDGAEWLAPFVGVYGGPLASKFEQAMDVATHFGFPNIVTYKMKTQQQVDSKRSLNRQGVAANIPTILVEIGENGSRSTAHAETVVAGLNSALVQLGMLPKKISQVTPPVQPNYFTGTTSVPVDVSGIWFPRYSMGRNVEKNEVLGEVKDYFGQVIATVRSPATGYALYGLAGLPVKQGESVMTIALK